MGVNGEHEPYRLAMVLFRYFPWGGMQRNFLRIAEACLARGYRVDVYTLDWQGERPAGLNVRVVNAGRGSNIRRYESLFRKLPGLFSQQAYDLVLGFNRMPGLDLYYAADPCFVERVRKTRPWYYSYTPRFRHFRAIERQLFSPEASTHIMALSQTQIDDYVSSYQTPRSRFTLLPPGVPARFYRGDNAAAVRVAFRRQHGIRDDEYLLLMIGSGFSRKGFDRGLRAVAALPETLRQECRVWVVGKGREKALRRLARRQGLDSQLQIISGSDELPRFMLGADLLMHPARSENTGNVIVEAIAAGLPVICTEHCGYASHVDEGNAGLLIPEPYTQAAMNGLLRQMLDIQALQQWRNNALAYAGRTDLYSRLEHALNLIERLAGERRHA